MSLGAASPPSADADPERAPRAAHSQVVTGEPEAEAEARPVASAADRLAVKTRVFVRGATSSPGTVTFVLSNSIRAVELDAGATVILSLIHI